MGQREQGDWPQSVDRSPRSELGSSGMFGCRRGCASVGMEVGVPHMESGVLLPSWECIMYVVVSCRRSINDARCSERSQLEWNAHVQRYGVGVGSSSLSSSSSSSLIHQMYHQGGGRYPVLYVHPPAANYCSHRGAARPFPGSRIPVKNWGQPKGKIKKIKIKIKKGAKVPVRVRQLEP